LAAAPLPLPLNGQGRLTILVLSLCVAPAIAQTKVRPYPDPAHRWLGVYAGGPEQHFDYFLRKLSLGDSFPDKAAWWEGRRKELASQDGPHRHDVFIVYCGEKAGDLRRFHLGHEGPSYGIRATIRAPRTEMDG